MFWNKSKKVSDREIVWKDSDGKWHVKGTHKTFARKEQADKIAEVHNE